MASLLFQRAFLHRPVNKLPVLLKQTPYINARLVGTNDSIEKSNTGKATTKTYTKEVFEKLVNTNKVVIFMKGNPEAPRCGFSNAVVQILRMHGVQYDAHDVLQNDELRQGIKEFSDWPTIPQVFINGEFVGGCDILLQMHQNGELVETLNKIGISSILQDAQPKNTEIKKPDGK